MLSLWSPSHHLSRARLHHHQFRAGSRTYEATKNWNLLDQFAHRTSRELLILANNCNLGPSILSDASTDTLSDIEEVESSAVTAVKAFLSTNFDLPLRCAHLTRIQDGKSDQAR